MSIDEAPNGDLHDENIDESIDDIPKNDIPEDVSPNPMFKPGDFNVVLNLSDLAILVHEKFTTQSSVISGISELLNDYTQFIQDKLEK